MLVNDNYMSLCHCYSYSGCLFLFLFSETQTARTRAKTIPPRAMASIGHMYDGASLLPGPSWVGLSVADVKAVICSMWKHVVHVKLAVAQVAIASDFPSTRLPPLIGLHYRLCTCARPDL